MAVVKVFLCMLVFTLALQSCCGAMHVEKGIRRNKGAGATVTRNIKTTRSNTASKEQQMKNDECCPTMCTCDETGNNITHRKTFTIRDCLIDPTVELNKLMSKFCYYDSYRIVRAKLSNLPCKVLSALDTRTTDYVWKLDLSENELHAPFCDSLKLKSLVSLNVSHNSLETECIPLNTSIWLFDIDFSYNKMSTVPCSIGDLIELQRLDLSYNQIMSVPCNLSGIPLQILNMTHNHLETFPCNLSTLTRLLYLNLSHNHIEGMYCQSQALSGLQELDLSNNYLKTVPGYLGGLPALKTLDLSWNYLKVVSCDLVMSPTLEWLLMHHNLLEDIECNLSNMSALYALDLSYNKFITMPCNLSPQKRLHYLDLGHNQIQTVPCTLIDMTWDLVLNLTYNEMLTLPCNLTTFAGRSLDVSHNKLDRIYCKFPEGNFAALVLNLSYNLFQAMPCELANRYFITIDMSHNVIETVACDLSDLFVLSLNLDNNKLGTVPSNLSSIPNIKYLYLNNNHIKTLPPFCLYRSSLDNISSLSSLYLDSNEISTLVNESFSGLQALANISLKNNGLNLIESGVFKDCHHLERVHLENNSLHTLDSWPRHHENRAKLAALKLYVSNNKLSIFSNSVKSPLSSCRSLMYDSEYYVNANNISHFMDVFHGWNLKVTTTNEIHRCLMHFDFSHNPLVCDCIDYDVYAAIHNKTVYLSKNLTCSEPQSLKGLNPSFIPLDRFSCNLFEKCPEGCLCHDNPHFRNVSVICNGQKGEELPKELPGLSKDSYSYDLEWTRTTLETVSYRSYLMNTSEAIFSNNLIKNITLDALLSLVNVSKLYLDNNKMKYLPDGIGSVTLGPDVELKLGNNPWVCDCEAVAMKKWLLKYHQNIQDLNNIRCFFPSNTRGKLMIDIDNDVMCPHLNPTPIVAILGGIISFLVICLPLLCVIKVKRSVRGHTRVDWQPLDWDEEVDKSKEFDVFLSYATEDEDYVEGFLISELENRGFKVCFHRVHFLAGKSIIDNISECIMKSKNILTFYSVNYKQSYFGMYEFTLALHLDIENRTNRVVAIKDTDLDIEDLQISHSTYFRTHSYVIKDEPTFWRNLLYTLPKHKLGEMSVEESQV